MKSINEIKDDFNKGAISRDEYRKEMFLKYRALEEYRSLLTDAAIEITADDILLCVNKGKTNEFRMEIRENDTTCAAAIILSHGAFEPNELAIVKQVWKIIDAKVMFDIGANVGWYSLNFLSEGDGRKTFSFEPSSENFASLKKNVALSGFNQLADLFNCGLYKETKEVEFYYDVEATGASSMVDLRGQGTTKVETVKMRKLDDVVVENEIDRIDFIKCDVEGSELFVYEGGLESIKKYRPVVFSEMLRKWSAKFGYHPNNIIELFKNIGYECFAVSENGLRKLDEVTEETVETNYLFLDCEKHAEIIQQLVK